MRGFSVFLLISGIAFSCFAQEQGLPKKDATIRYVALGDSYTIGEGAGQENSWPALLTGHLKQEGIPIDLVAQLAQTGWTTQNLIDLYLPVFEASQPRFATLLIGVNDWVQGIDSETFRSHVKLLLSRMQEILPQKDHLLVINIPDFSVTPYGHNYSLGRDISSGISEFNAIILEEAAALGLKVVDIFAISQQMGQDARLVSSDGLHPSPEEYAIWERIIYPEAYRILMNDKEGIQTRSSP